MVDFTPKDAYGIADLVEIVRLLRAPGGCPWDREQDHHTIRKNLIEETYEVAEAIDLEDRALLREELGDLLLQVVLHAQMEAEAGTFDFSGVCNDICQKLIVRHPHVFGQVSAKDTDEVLKNWEAIKQRTKGQTTAAQTLESVPKTLPALMRAEKLQKRAAKTGFDYPDLQWAAEDLESELHEVKEAIAKGDKPQMHEELGDLLFAAVNVARFMGADPEEALSRASDKFTRRFTRVEELAAEQQLEMNSCGIDCLNGLWAQAKREE